MTQETGTLEARLKRDALALGFADCAICRADEPWQAGERLEAFVEEGRHGEMDWMEATLKRLLEEIEATKRRVNALEFKVIPELEEAQVFIKLRLEEMEREETFRLKRFKNK